MVDNIPLKQVALLISCGTMISTMGETVYTEMNNTKSLCSQLIQSYIPLHANEQVYRRAKMMQLWRPEEFMCIILCLGMLHTAKTCWNGVAGAVKEVVQGMYRLRPVSGAICNPDLDSECRPLRLVAWWSKDPGRSDAMPTVEGIRQRELELTSMSGNLRFWPASGVQECRKNLLHQLKAYSTQLMSNLHFFSVTDKPGRGRG